MFPPMLPLSCDIPSVGPDILPHCAQMHLIYYLCEAVSAFCKLSGSLEGRMKKSNILHDFFCSIVPAAKPSSFHRSRSRRGGWRPACCTFYSLRETENLGGEQKARLQNTSKVKPVQVRELLQELLQVRKIWAQSHQIKYSVAQYLQAAYRYTKYIIYLWFICILRVSLLLVLRLLVIMFKQENVSFPKMS